ncbi:MAG: SDR family NAD(P)-dependent oxidoreductase [Gammaproteobacteria bacterium]|nr:SDR family NAD(P)-dependent oxidoreductase [Gammaproteobacteria bacterium]MCY4199110.1 SDR family NAD(P)-dependent oxidoreductase [Gammaproteobacteria bacterium]MCY4278194.1 SDR family NAD(P)-dependent oxidoreductase [Gammaproteobacteria bacterium]MCY4323508.1 SDR family NAD(P)-dependent oxidoreductase [Gammaproteobacteria bacterium]
MEISNGVVVVTGGASGIGRALARAFAVAGARHVVVADRDEAGARAVAAEIGGRGVGMDVASESQIRQIVVSTDAEAGPVDIMVSNAGYVTWGGLETSNHDINRMWEVHVMSHIYAARAVLPSMIERGCGYIMSTASAAGLLTQIGSLAYSITKHAAVSLAEWIAITHGQQGIGVSVLCPQAVDTNIGANSPQAGTMPAPSVAAGDGVLTSEHVAAECLAAIREERFWVLPHPEVGEYVRRKAADIDRWLYGMQRFQARLFEGADMPADWLTANSPKAGRGS